MITKAVPERENYLNASYGIKCGSLQDTSASAAVSRHITLFFFIGGAFATMIRIERSRHKATLSPRRPITTLHMHGWR